MTTTRDWNHDGRVENATDAQQVVSSYRLIYSEMRFSWLMALAAKHHAADPAIAAVFQAALPPCVACKRPHRADRLVAPWVPDGACACCGQRW